MTIKMPNFSFFEIFPVCSQLLELCRILFAGRDEHFNNLVDFLKFNNLTNLVFNRFTHPFYYTLSGLVIESDIGPTFSYFLIQVKDSPLKHIRLNELLISQS